MGENVAVTSREQVWGQPSSKHQHEPDFLRNIAIKKIKGSLGILIPTFYKIISNVNKGIF